MMDKAFVLHLVEECWDVIQEEIKRNDDKDDGKQGVCARGKFTNLGTDMKYIGWSAKGIQRFNGLYALVEDIRNEPWTKKVEKEMNKKPFNRKYLTTDATKLRQKK
jgi:hypothetical protein